MLPTLQLLDRQSDGAIKVKVGLALQMRNLISAESWSVWRGFIRSSSEARTASSARWAVARPIATSWLADFVFHGVLKRKTPLCHCSSNSVITTVPLSNTSTKTMSRFAGFGVPVTLWGY